MPQGVRRMGLRRSRYIGEPRTHLQHMATAAAINLCRLHDWLVGISPIALLLRILLALCKRWLEGSNRFRHQYLEGGAPSSQYNTGVGGHKLVQAAGSVRT